MIDRTAARIIEYGKGITDGFDLSVAVGHNADHFLFHEVMGNRFMGYGSKVQPSRKPE